MARSDDHAPDKAVIGFILALILVLGVSVYIVQGKKGKTPAPETKPAVSKTVDSPDVPITGVDEDEEEDEESDENIVTESEDFGEVENDGFFRRIISKTKKVVKESTKNNTVANNDKPSNPSENNNSQNGSNNQEQNHTDTPTDDPTEEPVDDKLYELDEHDSSKIYMQDITDRMVEDWEDESVHTVTDRRTGIDYEVIKGHDGYWNPTLYMTTALRLGSDEKDMVLTPKHTNIYENYTLKKGSDQNGDYKPSTVLVDRYPSKESLMAKYYGAYNTEESICPKGWRLPSASENWKYNEIGETDFNQETHKIKNMLDMEYTASGTIKVPSFDADDDWNTAFGMYTLDEDYRTLVIPFDGNTSLKTICMYGKPMVLNRHFKFDYNGGESYGETESESDISIWTRWGTYYEFGVYPEREGYSLLGWSRDKNATEPEFYEGAEVEVFNSFDVTLYAVWKKNVTITFNANGSTFENGQEENVVTYPGPRVIRYSSKNADGSQKSGEFDDSDYKKGYSEFKRFTLADGPVKIRVKFDLAEGDVLCIAEGSWSADQLESQVGEANPDCPGTEVRREDYYYSGYPTLYYPNGITEFTMTIKSYEFGVLFYSSENGDHFEDGLYGFYIEAVEYPYPVEGEEMEPEYQNDGRIVIGWSTDPDAENPEYEYHDEWNNPMGKSIYTIDEDTTLYAIWGYPIGH